MAFDNGKTLGSAVDLATEYDLDDRRVGVRVEFHFILSRPTLWPTQPPKQWLSGALSPGYIASA
jgi:hypothetical protein